MSNSITPLIAPIRICNTKKITQEMPWNNWQLFKELTELAQKWSTIVKWALITKYFSWEERPQWWQWHIIQWFAMISVQLAFYGISWSKLEAFFDDLNKNSLASNVSILCTLHP